MSCLFIQNYVCFDSFEIKKKLKTAKKKEKEEKKKKQEEEQEKRKLSQVQDTQVVSKRSQHFIQCKTDIGCHRCVSLR